MPEHEGRFRPTTYAKHGSLRYNSETAKGCEEAGEPVFLLRAQDAHAAETVRFWADQVAPRNTAMADEARRIADEMEAWPVHKEPD